ncbi:MAG: zf-HC2 domain-containing protein [Clostridiales bacterium]|jgi:hypothetical protein|nr:zf-HC2 domain-containing protein [Clostridiales bacterium]
MECEKASALMMQYMDKTLSEADAAKLNSHIKGCPVCKEEFMVYDKILREFETMEVISAPDDFCDTVMEKIRALDFKRPASTVKDSMLCVIWGVFSVLLGLGLLASMYKDTVIEYLASTGRFDLFLKTLAPVTEYVNLFTEGLTNTFTSLSSGLSALVSPVRLTLLVIFAVLAGIQYVIYKKNKAEI